MTSLWLVANSKSGITDDSLIETTRQRMAATGMDVVRIIDLAEQELPDIGDDKAVPHIIASLGGDGTAGAIIARYGDSLDTALLILPGGTMNLLARRLHGDASVEEVIDRSARAPHIVALPAVDGPDLHSLVGVIAGPAAHWGQVREDIREGDLPTLLDSVPAALEETFGGERIGLRGQKGRHAALFIEPRKGALYIHAIRTDGLGDLARHGWAWLNRDFLGGPTEELMQGDEAVLEKNGGLIALLVDGERCSRPAPLRFRLGQCPARFIATLES